jgi:hypothetical protein
MLIRFQRAKTISETAEKVSDVLVFLSKTIPTVDVDNGLPRLLQQKQLDGIQFAAISLTASIMECLTVLVRYITESGKISYGPG